MLYYKIQVLVQRTDLARSVCGFYFGLCISQWNIKTFQYTFIKSSISVQLFQVILTKNIWQTNFPIVGNKIKKHFNYSEVTERSQNKIKNTFSEHTFSFNWRDAKR